jgi:hypothetical protein
MIDHPHLHCVVPGGGLSEDEIEWKKPKKSKKRKKFFVHVNVISDLFKWKNYRKEGKSEETSLEIFEFIRRFLLHVLPKNFYKIRYYGILASRNRKRKLALCREILEVIVKEIEPDKPEKSFEELFFELTGKEPGICPVCKKGRLVRKNKLKPEYLALI